MHASRLPSRVDGNASKSNSLSLVLVYLWDPYGICSLGVGEDLKKKVVFALTINKVGLCGYKIFVEKNKK
jgi:hypothetical protein